MRFVRCFLPLLAAMLLELPSFGQTGYVFTVAGIGGGMSTGDGGLALQAGLSAPNVICMDRLDNLYISEEVSNRIRKVDAATGIINTIAGTGNYGFSGDGGIGTSADIAGAYGMYCDTLGNLYFSDLGNSRVRRVDANTGIITTVAGNGSSTYSGDGGLAVNAGLASCTGILIDKQQDLYIGTAGAIRKVDMSTGIITTVVGTGAFGFSGDGGLATAAQIGSDIRGLAFDSQGDLYFSDVYNRRIRMVDINTGIITTAAGVGSQGFSGDGSLAISAEFDRLRFIYFDIFDNLYVADFGTANVFDGKIRRIDRQSGIINTIAGQLGGSTLNAVPAISTQLNPIGMCVDYWGNIHYAHDNFVRRINADTSGNASVLDSFKAFVFNTCANGTPHFAVTTTTYIAGITVKTYYSDGTSEVNALINAYGSGYASFQHTYPLSGHYLVKHVLYYGTSAIDSVEYDLDYKLCNTKSLSFYVDLNNNCVFEQGLDAADVIPKMVTVDSNGVMIDTLSLTQSCSYNAYGAIGDIYNYHVIQFTDLTPTCPQTGIVVDTIAVGVPEHSNVGSECGSGSSYDLFVNASMTTAANRSDINIVAANTFCANQNGVLTLTFSPKYTFYNASPVPASQVGNNVIWNLSDLNAFTVPQLLHVRLSHNGQLLTVGDTVHTSISLTPTTGDVNTANNMIIQHDTVTGPYDPNAVYVSPSTCVPPGTRLQYTVTFENMGNDTAHNIYVMDTLSDGVNMQSMKILAASHLMNVTKVSSGGYNILKFEFPNINLPDSSSPGRHGMVMYTMDTKSNYPIGSAVTNKAGIYFDYMPAVLTNVASTSMCWPANIPSVVSGSAGIYIYPNPATDELTIKTDKRYTSYTISNSIGQVMMKNNLTAKESKVNIRSLAPGIYYVSLKGEGSSEVRKFVKM